jgi:Protein of unknown function (DUF3619)
MNNLTKLSPDRRRDVLQERFARRVAAALTEQQAASPRHDIEERLRVAREQALALAPRTRSVPRTAGAPSVVGSAGGAAMLGGAGGDQTPWWLRLSALLPLAVLLVGLFLIDHRYTQTQIEAAAEVDAAILADDLPPEAYRDPGFVEYLKGENR